MRSRRGETQTVRAYQERIRELEAFIEKLRDEVSALRAASYFDAVRADTLRRAREYAAYRDAGKTSTEKILRMPGATMEALVAEIERIRQRLDELGEA